MAKRIRIKYPTGDEVDAMIESHWAQQERLRRSGRLHFVELTGIDRKGKAFGCTQGIETPMHLSQVKVKLYHPKTTRGTRGKGQVRPDRAARLGRRH